MTWLITPKQTLSVARAAGLGERELELEEFRERGCLCMENGEASALFAATRSKSPRRRALPALYRTGAGLGPHPPRRGLPRCLSPPGREAVLEASVRLRRQRLLESEKATGASLT